MTGKKRTFFFACSALGLVWVFKDELKKVFSKTVVGEDVRWVMGPGLPSGVTGAHRREEYPWWDRPVVDEDVRGW